MAEKKKNGTPKNNPGSFIKELLSGTMVSEKIILKNLWYVLLLTLLASIYRKQVSCRKDHQANDEAPERG